MIISVAHAKVEVAGRGRRRRGRGGARGHREGQEGRGEGEGVGRKPVESRRLVVGLGNPGRVLRPDPAQRRLPGRRAARRSCTRSPLVREECGSRGRLARADWLVLPAPDLHEPQRQRRALPLRATRSRARRRARRLRRRRSFRSAGSGCAPAAALPATAAWNRSSRSLQTEAVPRLRLASAAAPKAGRRTTGLADCVLADFLAEEEPAVAEMVERAARGRDRLARVGNRSRDEPRECAGACRPDAAGTNRASTRSPRGWIPDPPVTRVYRVAVPSCSAPGAGPQRP